MNKSKGALAEVEKKALELVDAGRFKHVAEARNHVFDREPELAEKVRVEAAAAYADGSAAPYGATRRESWAAQQNAELEAAGEVGKAMKLASANATVEKRAQQLVDARVFPTVQQARAHIFMTEPALASAFRMEDS